MDKYDKRGIKMNKTIGFIGCGNMGGSIARAVAKTGVNVLLSDTFSSKAKELAKEIKATATDNSTISKSADVVFLGVKPQVMANTVSEIKSEISKKENTLVISMAAGLSTQKIIEMFGKNIKLIRIMPNTPVGVGKGMILYSVTEQVTSDDISTFTEIMQYAGEIDFIDEKLIDAGSAVSGCGPAFVYMFIEALADGGVMCGLPRDKAIKYATQTLLGSAELLKSSGKHPGELKDAVCSPGGSTIEGVKALENGAFRGTVINAVSEAFNKTKELGK